MTLTQFLLLSLLLIPISLWSQQHQERFQKIDVAHYDFDLRLNDQTDQVRGEALIRIRFKEGVEAFRLDLVARGASGKGMLVTEVLENGKAVSYLHRGDTLLIRPLARTGSDTVRSYRIRYMGIPADGLIISNNKFGQRTFFGDNWPNRARHWLPTVDHPSDKATVAFRVTAPDHYQLVANGRQLEETNLTDSTKLTHWQTDVPLPTKVMVIGLAPFAVQWMGSVDSVPLSTWVFAENRTEGFRDYAIAKDILQWYIDHLAPYPYAKLANVQSKTRYGGMENASNIFYYENSVTGVGASETLFAHEIAHQWFGNTATEGNWHHLWLSEGFATYLTDLYVESTQGDSAFRERLRRERAQVIDFARRRLAPVIDTTVTDYNRLLNANSYQKGAWVLHMLRQRIGEATFWRALRTYYRRYRHRTALTQDFRRVAEELSDQNLEAFFRQWLYRSGHPKLQADWAYDEDGQRLELTIRQVQAGPAFQFPLEIGIDYGGERPGQFKALQVDQAQASYVLENVEQMPERVLLDPRTRLLFEEVTF